MVAENGTMVQESGLGRGKDSEDVQSALSAHPQQLDGSVAEQRDSKQEQPKQDGVEHDRVEQGEAEQAEVLSSIDPPGHPAPSIPTVESDLVADSDLANESAYEGSIFSDTTSLRSSIFQTLKEHGHGYHRDGRAILPVDETEQDRLDLQHHIFGLILDGDLMVSKLPDRAQTIIDVGTGTGIWAIETGDRNPLHQITGIDQSPIQPAWIPPNVSFEIDDVTKPWLNESNTVDFIHVRSMAGSIRGDSDWQAFLAEALRMLRPGGRIEVTDFTTRFQCDDGTFKMDSTSKLWEITLHDIARSMGIELETTDKMHGWLREAGFSDIQEIAHKVPVGPWPRDKKLKEIGRYHQAHMLEAGFENYSLFLFTQGGWSIESTHVILAKLKEEIRNPRIHTYAKAIFFTATKPFPGRPITPDEIM